MKQSLKKSLEYFLDEFLEKRKGIVRAGIVEGIPGKLKQRIHVGTSEITPTKVSVRVSEENFIF